MAKATPQQIFEELLKRYEGEIGDALLVAFSELRNAADIQRVYTALEAHDAEGVLTALHIDPAAFSVLIQAERNAFTAGGLSAASQLPPLTDRNGQSQVVRFDVAKPAVETWISTATTQTVGRIVEDQLVAIRAVISDGLARAVDPRSLALQIVGPINKVTGLREGGTIGLSAVQAQYAQTARAELEGADTSGLRNYLTRTLRDARYDTAVRNALETGKPIPANLIDRAVQSYQNRLILQRGRTVGTTEALKLLHAGQDAAFDQLAASGAIGDQDKIIGTWMTQGDDKVRASHAALDGEIRNHGEPFVSPLGSLMKYPGDTSMGAAAGDIVSCRCALVVTIVRQANDLRSAA